MKEIIKLILKYHFTITFILLEAVAFSLIVQHNHYQRTVFSGRTAAFFNYLSSGITGIDDYLSLRSSNERLVAENLELRNKLETLKREEILVGNDSLLRVRMNITTPGARYFGARIVNTSFNKTKNYIMINKGSADGIEKEMAVCSEQGIVGIVQNTNRHFSVVLPLINTNLRVSAKLKKNGYYGSLQWDGNDYRYSNLNDIPFHVNVEQGDTIVTSGFSSIFPEGELVGFVESVDKETANFLSIKVKLAEDFKQVTTVYVIADLRKKEKLQLEETIHE